MRIDKKCQVCGTPFTAIKTNQYFCSRKCFKKAYNVRKREERKHDRETNPARFGWYVCTACGAKTPLPYSPKRYKVRFETYECPICGVPRFKDSTNMREDWEWDVLHWRNGYVNPGTAIEMTTTITYNKATGTTFITIDLRTATGQ